MSAELKVQQSFSDKAKFAVRAVLPEKLLDVAKRAYHSRFLNKSEKPTYPRTIEVAFTAGSFTLEVTTELEEYEAKSLIGEREQIESILAELEPETVFLDIGANVGVDTLAANLRTTNVYAVEPDREIYEGLCKNVGLNNADVTLFNIAAWESDTVLDLFSKGRGSDAPRTAQIGASTKSLGENNTQVKARSIASLVKEGMPAPDVIKVDVEGAEYQVLRGLGELRPGHIFLEVHLLTGQDLFALGSLLNKMGYEPVSNAKLRGHELLCHFALR